MTVSEVIDEARDLHPSFTPEKCPSRTVRRFLSSWQQDLIMRASQIKRDLFQSVETITLPLGDFDAGETITGGLLIHGGTINFTNTNLDPESLEIVPFTERLDRYRFRWGAYIQGTQLYLLGRATDWTEVATIDLYYSPAVADLTDGSSAFVLTGHPKKAAVRAAASFMAERADLDGMWEAKRVEAEKEWIDEVTGRLRATIGTVREVW